MPTPMSLVIWQQIHHSVKAGVPVSSWIPTITSGGEYVVQDTVAKEVADHIEANYKRPDLPKRKCEAQPNEQPCKPVPPGHKHKHAFEKYVHPDSDFSHIDPKEFDTIYQNSTRPKPTQEDYEKVRSILFEESLGMQRLACVFEWVLAKATDLLEEINNSLGTGRAPTTPDPIKYKNACEAYIAFLKDLDEHKPHARGITVIPGEPGKSGYGQAMKWAYIFPAIYNKRIYGAKVIIMWNPHSSSNGIPTR